jgi:hypothetical protein
LVSNFKADSGSDAGKGAFQIREKVSWNMNAFMTWQNLKIKLFRCFDNSKWRDSGKAFALEE